MIKTIFIVFLILCPSKIIGQGDSLNWDEVNDFLNYQHNDIPADSVLTNLEKKYNLSFSSLLNNIILYGSKNDFNNFEIIAIENRTRLLVNKYFEIDKPIKIIKEGGVNGGGKMKIKKSMVNGKILYTIVLSKTDLVFDNDKFQDELIELINQETFKLLKI